MLPPYLLSALAAAGVVALVVGYIEMVHSARPSAKPGGLATTHAERSTADVARLPFALPIHGGGVSSPATGSGSASVSSSSSTGGILKKARGFRLTPDGCYESDPAVEGDPPGFQRTHKVDVDECPFLRYGTPGGLDSR
jgi:hypothetical protein